MTVVVRDAPVGAEAGVRLRVLGGIAARLGDEPVRLRGPRHREVLARLVVGRGRVVPVDRLIDDLWPAAPPGQALAAVQKFVSQLRRALEPDRAPRAPARVLVTEPPGYALRLDAFAVDAWELERLVAQAGELLDDGHAALAHARADAAIALCRGPAFAEFADAAWARVEADRLAETALLAHERRAAAALALGRVADLLPELEAHAAAHPLREEAWRLLALAHYASGRQGDALATLRRVRATLRDELGVDPGPVLRRTERDVLDQAVPLPERPVVVGVERAAAGGGPAVPSGPAARAVPGPPAPAGIVVSWPAVPPAPSTAAPHPVPFVGRAAELAVLRSAAASAAGGRGGLVLVSGAPGAGKSALAGRLAAELGAAGWRTAAGWCPRDAPPAWPWIELLETLTAQAPPAGILTGREAASLDGLLAADGPPDDGAGPAAARFRRHRAVGAYLAGLAASRPLLLLLDDLHDADDDTLALLCRLAPDLGGTAVLVVAMLRDGEAGTDDAPEDGERLACALAELARHLPVRVTLGGLDDAAVGELVRSVCTAPVADRTVAELALRTGGNPFLVTECARLLQAEGPEAATTEVPAGVRDVLAQRIARLPAPSRALLANAAVVGRGFDVELLAEVTAEHPDAVLDAVEPAVAAGLVVEPGPGRLEFAHALVRDVAYGSLSRLRRARVHGRVAWALERTRPGEVAALAYHVAASGADDAAGSAQGSAAVRTPDARTARAVGAAAAPSSRPDGTPATGVVPFPVRTPHGSPPGRDALRMQPPDRAADGAERDARGARIRAPAAVLPRAGPARAGAGRGRGRPRPAEAGGPAVPRPTHLRAAPGPGPGPASLDEARPR
ncbi:MAG: BTAD domain-containing putative transcriptional regulator [Pseudonocardia sp.]